MRILQTIVVAFSMFSALPMPHFEWTEKNMRYFLCAFPLVGAVAGGVCWLWVLFANWFGLPSILLGAGLCLLPILITGGIHLDGYCDTCDALASHADKAKKQEILKDSHLGAFAAIRLGVWLIADFALWTALPAYRGGVILLSFCLSRCLSGLAIASFPLARNSGLAHTFAQTADRKLVRIILLAAALVMSLVMGYLTWEGLAMAAVAWVVFLYYYFVSRRHFGGLSGDLAGWFLQKAELWMLLVLCLFQYAEGALLL